jgi:hypothetical protein
VVSNEEAIDKCDEELTSPSKRPQRRLHSSVDPTPFRGPPHPLVFMMKYA